MAAKRIRGLPLHLSDIRKAADDPVRRPFGSAQHASRGQCLNDRLNPPIGRREFLRVLAVGGAAAATAAPLAPAVADSESEAEKRKPRYQANSPEVQTFYRVNRYPAK